MKWNEKENEDYNIQMHEKESQWERLKKLVSSSMPVTF